MVGCIPLLLISIYLFTFRAFLYASKKMTAVRKWRLFRLPSVGAVQGYNLRAKEALKHMWVWRGPRPNGVVCLPSPDISVGSRHRLGSSCHPSYTLAAAYAEKNLLYYDCMGYEKTFLEGILLEEMFHMMSSILSDFTFKWTLMWVISSQEESHEKDSLIREVFWSTNSKSS